MDSIATPTAPKETAVVGCYTQELLLGVTHRNARCVLLLLGIYTGVFTGCSVIRQSQIFIADIYHHSEYRILKERERERQLS